jgi:hypothetical protein
MAFSITTCNIMTFRIMMCNIMALSIWAFVQGIFSIRRFSIMDLIVTLSIKGTQQNDI